MFAIITAILGMVGGAIPELIKFFKVKQDQKHELEVMKLQIENTKILGAQRLDEIQVQRDIGEAQVAYEFAAPPKGSGLKIIDGIVYILNGLVRPIVTYYLTACYGLNKLGITNIPWSAFDQGLFSGVMAFWFTNRAMRRAFEYHNNTTDIYNPLYQGK